MKKGLHQTNSNQGTGPSSVDLPGDGYGIPDVYILVDDCAIPDISIPGDNCACHGVDFRVGCPVHVDCKTLFSSDKGSSSPQKTKIIYRQLHTGYMSTQRA